MSKLSLIILLAVVCTLEANNFFYYPSTVGALNYQYNPYAPYVYSAYAVPVDCDKSGSDEGSSKESSESSESESSSKEVGESESGSSESSEGGEKAEGSSSEELKEGGESSSESSSSEESGEKKEEGKKEEGKKESKVKQVKYVFPPLSYPFPPTTAQQVVYSSPSYGYLPYRSAYSAIQQPTNYAVKSSGYNYQPYYGGSYTAPVARIVSSPVNKVVSYPGLTKTITFAPASGVGGPAGYWNGNVGYYRA
ncbi:hypothetical protein JTE90_024950 [Oedothorax gibbosus]|uniref:Uncharacterized protein n=1 Tax=Oedothorax gibbosus TaxID=931172 RepID=A0AAV6VWG8_9ARAC|nr:hypothetical protein JTE90_024950 [Oedothorax gibbosus]